MINGNQCINVYKYNVCNATIQCYYCNIIIITIQCLLMLCAK